MPLKKKRQANFELLRIIAMLMVITLHYLTKGNVAIKLSQDASLFNHILWLIEAFCNVAVNVYVLISGYFLVEAKWNPSKIMTLILEVLFYSILTPVVLMAFKILPVGEWNLYDWMNVLLPIQTEHYWFATAYVVMYLLSPLLSIAIKQMPKKQLQITIGLLLVFFSLTKSINPVHIATDHYGYDFGWFICLFLIAGYIRIYGITLFKNGKRSTLYYIIGTIFTFAICAVFGYICRKTGKLEYYMDMTYSYNYILVLFSSVSLFYTFLYIKMPEGKITNLICRIAPYTFGVYLLHENIAVRLNWPIWLGVNRYIGTPKLLLHMCVSVLLVFIIGTVIDGIRTLIFRFIGKFLS